MRHHRKKEEHESGDQAGYPNQNAAGDALGSDTGRTAFAFDLADAIALGIVLDLPGAVFPAECEETGGGQKHS
ncbi:MAG TPA: hypothetical protein VKT81_10020 [Bryobacteraceae bacterium]|nr:hypothetical protein [Bryobacteraceae bacterium]